MLIPTYSQSENIRPRNNFQFSAHTPNPDPEDPFIFLKNTEAPFLDLKYVGFTDVSYLKRICLATPHCAGFNSNGWLKYSVENKVASPKQDLYVRKEPPQLEDLPPFSVWPQPAAWTNGTERIPISQWFTFRSAGHTSDILLAAFDRYNEIIFPLKNFKDVKPQKFRKELTGLDVNVLDGSTELQLGVDESYTLFIPETGDPGYLISETVYGALRGLETFSQLIEFNWEGDYWINAAPLTIKDKPLYPHRGLLIDTSRHYLPMETIFKQLDAMSYAKLNTLHWHIVDDQSFPFMSITYPNLSEKGSYDPKRAIYTPNDVQEIINYAKHRGIRVMPEFDMPGHTSSWMRGYPELQGSGLCCLDPTLNSTYVFIENLFAELNKVFPERYLHIGGDEVDFGCWSSSEKIKQFMKDNNITSYAQLEDYFEERVLKLAAAQNVSVMCWEELFDNGLPLPKNVVIEVWKGGDPRAVLHAVVQQGFRGVMSSFWYLDHLGDTWATYYSNPIDDGTFTPKERELIMGGEACMWGEWVNEKNAIPRVWPRAAAVAEVLWSPLEYPKIPNRNALRLHHWTCRVNYRGIDAEPVGVNFGPSFCQPI